MSPSSNYLIDSDVLITVKNRYYAFPVCPGFWESVLHGHSRGHLHSIDRVRQELLKGREDDDLVRWVRQSVPPNFFLPGDGGEVVAACREVISWVTHHPQYQDEAKAKFAGGADGWLIAHGVITGRTVATNEQPRPESRSVIKMPDVCHRFNVQSNLKTPFPCCIRSVSSTITRASLQQCQPTPSAPLKPQSNAA